MMRRTLLFALVVVTLSPSMVSAQQAPASGPSTAPAPPPAAAAPSPAPPPAPVLQPAAPPPLAAAVAVPAGITVAHSSWASLTVAAILQVMFQGRVDGSDLDRNTDGVVDARDDVFLNNHTDFLVHRARVFLKGHLISPQLTYMFQGDAALADFGLDVKLGYTIPEGKNCATTIFLGRFLPPFTLTLPRPVSRLDAINYPLYLFSGLGGSRQPFATPNSVGRQTGLVINQKLWMFSFDFGVFNGYQRTTAAQTQIATLLDDNDEKDFLVRAAVTPWDGVSLAADLWLGFPVSLTTPDPTVKDDQPRPFAKSASDSSSQNDRAIFGVFEVEVTRLAPFKLEGELAVSHQTSRTLDATGTRSSKKATALGGWFHAAYTFKKLLVRRVDLETFARFDYLDPDIDTASNGQLRLTLGPQLFMEELHAQLRFNYMLNMFDTKQSSWGDVRHEFWIQAAMEI